MNDQIEKAVEILNQGGIVIFPTDTAFGIGCRIDRESTIKKLFEIRKRPLSQAVPVLVGSLEMAKEYADISEDIINKLVIPFWPGALTIVLNAKLEKVPTLVRGGGNTIGLRQPKHEMVSQIIKKTGVPILGPSANFHGEKTPFAFEDLDKKLIKLADFAVKGETFLMQASTVVDCTSSPWQILRKGATQVNI